MKAAIVGLSGPTLRPEEAALFRACPPAGVILFARNIQLPAQLAALVAALREVLPADAVLMVDQEGGRVARLRPPSWLAHPAAAAIGRLYATDPAGGRRAAWLTGALIGLDCAAAGFDVVAAPVLDLAVPGAHAGIGDRAFAADPAVVAALGGAVAEGLLAAGVIPVMKHIPGHGRAGVDSHLALPTVTATDTAAGSATDTSTDLATDLAAGSAADLAADVLPFTALAAAIPWAMTAHIVYTAWDRALPATLSPAVIGSIIRDRIGYRGVLVSDDLAMQALAGEPATLAVQALDAGCDLALYCAGTFAPTAALLAACPPVSATAERRLAAGRAMVAAHRAAPSLHTPRAPGPAGHRLAPSDRAALASERDRWLACRGLASRGSA